uniref:Uncharacterized protein n=1 Tax=Vespula pensylvanica TaxID=30213 RepID=A0A834JL89_VESPE|nr:hypothetical protein H0235_017723 [Vespula pensylvanica]
MSPLESPSSMRRNERDEPPLAASAGWSTSEIYTSFRVVVRRDQNDAKIPSGTGSAYDVSIRTSPTSPPSTTCFGVIEGKGKIRICKCASGENAPLFLAQANEGVAGGKGKLCVFSVCEPARRYFRVVFGFIPEGWSVQLADVERRIAVKAPPPRDTS